MKTLRLLAPIALAIFMAHGANASVVGSLVFIEPTGTVTADQSIDVWVRLTLDPSSDPLTYLPQEPFPNGVNPDDIPLEGDVFGMFAEYDSVSTFVGRSCSDTFTVVCDDPGSQYEWNTTTSDWFNFEGTINPGESLDILLYSFDPLGGLAAPGFYELYTAILGLRVTGTDADGNFLFGTIYRFETDCPDANCTFSRTVTPVPLPAAIWLFGTALLGLVRLSRRRR